MSHMYARLARAIPELTSFADRDYEVRTYTYVSCSFPFREQTYPDFAYSINRIFVYGWSVRGLR